MKTCAQCGFQVGDKVVMYSALRRTDERGHQLHRSRFLVCGVVRSGLASGCGHYVSWEETGLVTALPNPNVRKKS